MMPLTSTLHDRLIFRPLISREQFEISLVVRVFADQGRRKDDASSISEVTLLGTCFETRGGFLFPMSWDPSDFHGLNSDFGESFRSKSNNDGIFDFLV
jgi:hypothetical protein